MMTAEQLKGSILQLAMQGKLVEQRPEEGMGEDLYEEILKERQRLVKEGKIKKEKGQTDKTEEPPFDIPESWKWAKLNDIVAKTIKRGKSPKYTQKSDTLVFAQKCNTKAGIIDLSLCLFLDDNQLSKYPEEEFMINNDIVINSTGNGTLGRVNIYRDTDNPQGIPIVPDSHVTVIRCNRHMEVRYVFYCLKYYQPYMEKLGSGSTNQTELGAGILKELAFPLPPLAEQKRIVAKIEELMPFVEQYAAASTNLNTLNTTFPDMMKKSILQEAVQGKLVPQDPNDEPASVLLKKIAEEKKRLIKEGKIKKQKPLPEITEDEIPFDIPESWEWVRFSDIMNSILTGPFGSMLHKTDYEREGIPIVNPIHMQGGRIIPSGNSLISKKTAERLSTYKLQTGDIVLARRGDIGRSAVVHEAENGWICGTGSFFATPAKGINPDFISLMFTTPYVRQALLGESVGTTMNNLNQKILISFLFPLPPEKEQERIRRAFNNLNRVVAKLVTIS